MHILDRAKNFYWHRGLQKSRTKALKDHLSKHLGTTLNIYVFEHLKMLISCKMQKYFSHLAATGMDLKYILKNRHLLK